MSEYLTALEHQLKECPDDNLALYLVLEKGKAVLQRKVELEQQLADLKREQLKHIQTKEQLKEDFLAEIEDEMCHIVDGYYQAAIDPLIKKIKDYLESRKEPSTAETIEWVNNNIVEYWDSIDIDSEDVIIKAVKVDDLLAHLQHKEQE